VKICDLKICDLKICVNHEFYATVCDGSMYAVFLL
jgi:hypothetical protein